MLEVGGIGSALAIILKRGEQPDAKEAAAKCTERESTVSKLQEAFA